MSSILSYAISAFSNIIILMICVEAVMSWFVQSFTPGIGRFYNMLCSLTEPFMMPFRKLLSPITFRMGIDISPIFSIIVIQFIARILIMIVHIIF